MLERLNLEGCIYQEDVVDYLVKANREEFLKENADGNQVLEKNVLSEFMKLTETTVVWVRSERYWRFRVAEDEAGREARG
jgi:hypothetical protein